MVLINLKSFCPWLEKWYQAEARIQSVDRPANNVEVLDSVGGFGQHRPPGDFFDDFKYCWSAWLSFIQTTIFNQMTTENSTKNTATGSAGESNDSSVVAKTNEGIEIRGAILRLTRHLAVFEIYGSDTIIQTSESFENFKILIGGRVAYLGRAVVSDLLNTGTGLACSVVLDDFCFNTDFFNSLGKDSLLCERFEDFIRQWQSVCTVLPEFKVVVADIETFLIDLRRWMEQIEIGTRSSLQANHAELERVIIGKLSPQVISVLDSLFEKFEHIAAGLDENTRPVHRLYIQRHLHPIVLCAPFANRCYQKPLGYAGDYGMVNMMLGDPQQGSSLFAKIFNVWLIHQGSAAAHRNRVNFLKQRLEEETAAAVRAGRTARILSLGCGPAWELQEFLAQSELCNRAQFTLVD